MFCVNSCSVPSEWPPWRGHCYLTVVCSSFRRRSRSRRRHNKVSLPNNTNASSAVIDLTPLRRFVSSGVDAYRDLQTLVTLDHNRTLVISCRPSTFHFLAALTFLLFSLSSISRFWSSHRNSSPYNPVLRRDRSLGGKEVVVAWAHTTHTNPLSPPVRNSLTPNNSTNNNQRNFPKWWPTLINSNASLLHANHHHQYKRDAYRVVRAITNSRLGGNDIMEDDIIQLRQLCRTSGVQVSIEPTNIRDSLYRASVNFVLNVCSRAPTYSTSIDIDGEDAPQFIAGFAENIGLENVRAVTIVSAAVAARTRSCLLQAWALEMQGKQDDAMVELSKICLLLQIFPPEESSPEIEMVCRGLVKHLRLEQRKHLMFLFGKVCGDESQRIAREALGLTHSQTSDQLEDNMLREN